MKHLKVWIPLVSFFAIMLIATIVSENIYYDNLPVIELGVAKEDNLSTSYFIEGNVEYGKKLERLTSGFDFTEVTILAEDGITLAASDPIYSVSLDEISILQKQLELDVSTLAKQNLVGGIEKLQQELNTLQIAEINRQIKTLSDLYKNNGIVYAQKACAVTYLITSGEPIHQGQGIATLSINTKNRYVIWQMSAAQKQLFTIGNSVQTNLFVKTENDEVEQKSFDLVISKLQPMPQSEGSVFTAEIPANTALAMNDGAITDINCKYISSEVYKYVLPISAITFESNSSGDTNRGYVYAVMTRQRAYGEERYAVPFYIEIQRRLDNYVALTNLQSGLEIVFETSKPLDKDMAIKVMKK